LILFCLALLVPPGASLGETEGSGELEDELAEIKHGLERMRASYESRIEALEDKVGEQDLLRAEVDEKDDEIRALKDKVMALEEDQDGGSLARRVEQLERAEGPRHKAAPVGAYGGLMNPDISFIANMKGFLSSDDDNPLNQRFLIQEAELGFQGFLWPGIRGDAFVALEQHVEGDGHVTTEIDLEEAYVSFLDLPAGFQLQAGRKLQNFGRLNAIHPHHWAFPDTPLPLLRLFGDHPWLDDGVQISTLIPNRWDAYVKVEGGVWSGWQPGHAHEHEEEIVESPDLDQVTRWSGNVFTARASLGFPLGDNTNLMPGYSFAGDDGGDTFLHGLDLTLIHRWPRTYRRLRWQNELFYRDTRVSPTYHGGHDDHDLHAATRDADDWGGYSLLAMTLDKYWETGVRFDWWDADHLDGEWGMTTFLTYFFSHSMYLRPAYRYNSFPDGSDEHLALVQFFWGLGPHAHRLED